MNDPFLCGANVAWTLALVATGVFFLVAYRLARRAQEYLLFGLLCFALATVTAGAALGYAATGVERWQVGSRVAMAGVIAATALNLHFVMRYTGAKRGWRIAGVVYGVAAAGEVLNGFGFWSVPGSTKPQSLELFGFAVTHLRSEQTALAMVFDALAVGTLLVCLWLLFDVYRSGQREALSALFGAALVPLSAAHDVARLWDKGGLGLYLSPHAFLLYALSVAGTLLFRYRQAAGQLESARLSLQLRTEELERSYHDLEAMEQELMKQQLLASVGELAAAIAHEVRNPLAVIVNAAAGLRRPTLRTEDRNVLLGILDEEAMRLDRLVADLLTFARPVKVARSEVSLAELASKVLSGLEEKYQTRLSIPTGPEIDTVFVDAGLLKLVVDNLVENACQAMPDGGLVSVSAQAATLHDAPAVCLLVTDQGRGMDARTRERATKPFFTTRPTGTGLGLAIVERIVQAHGGELEIASEPGQGTVVSVLLPRGDPRARGRRWTSPGLGERRDPPEGTA